jgi:acyl carrier protein
MNDTADVLTTVREAFKSAFEIDPRLVSLETSPSDIPGWDSVGHLSLASELEQTFGISLDVDELYEMENVREIMRIITKRLSTKVPV